jgi:hypothetical protein
MVSDYAFCPIEFARIGKLDPNVHEVFVVVDRTKPECEFEPTLLPVNDSRNLVRKMPTQASGVGFAVRGFNPGFGNYHAGSEPIGKTPVQGARIGGMRQWLETPGRPAMHRALPAVSSSRSAGSSETRRYQQKPAFPKSDQPAIVKGADEHSAQTCLS